MSLSALTTVATFAVVFSVSLAIHTATDGFSATNTMQFNKMFSMDSASFNTAQVGQQHHQLQAHQVENDVFLPTVSRGWSGFANWKGQCQYDPVVASINNEGLDAFCTWHDNTVRYRGGHHGHLADWENLGGCSLSAPAVDVHDDGEVNVAVRGCDNLVYTNLRLNGSWTSFKQAGLKTFVQPALASWFNHAMYVFAKAPDNTIWKKGRRHGRWWGDWYPLGSQQWYGPLSAISVDSKDSLRILLFAFDSQWTLHYTIIMAGGWEGNWISLGKVGTHAPALATREDGIDIVLRTPDGSLFVNSWYISTGWGGWADIKFKTPRRAGIAAHSKLNTLYIIALASDNTARYCRRKHGRWDAWQSYIHGNWASAPVLQTRENKFFDAWMLDTVSALKHSHLDFNEA